MDESGHTGSNSFDEQQPFFVCGGWIIPRRAEVVCRAWVKLAIGSRPNKAELKSTSLFRSASGREFARGLIAALIREGATPAICVAEKRFCVAIRLLDTVLSPDVSPEIALILPIARNLDRRIIAEKIADAPIEELRAYVQAWDAMDEQQIRIVVERIAQFLDRGHTSEVAFLLRLGVKSLRASLAADRDIFPERGRKRTRCVCLPAFHGAVDMACRLQVASPENPLDVVHDRTEFEEVFRKAMEAMRDARSRARTWHLQDGTERSLAFGGAGGISFQESKSEPLLQAADVLVGFAMRLLGESPSDAAADEIAELRSLFFSDTGRIVTTNYFATSAMALKLGASPPPAVW
jgi:hypothetical protein